MKSISEIISQTPVFLEDFRSELGVFEQFCNDSDLRWSDNREAVRQEFEDVKVLFAYYSYENYSGYAWVLFEKNGRLYETNGSHCSCYGLEGQWSYEKVDLDELENRLTKGTFGKEYDRYGGEDGYRNTFAYELKEFIGINTNKEDFEAVAEDILGWLN